MTEHQVKYHEQTLSRSVVPNRIEIRISTLPDRRNASSNQEKTTLWSTVSNAVERSIKQVILNWLDQGYYYVYYMPVFVLNQR